MPYAVAHNIAEILRLLLRLRVITNRQNFENAIDLLQWEVYK
jgi:hypothetical protein